ncbi:MAG: glutathione S-transferase [Myxococcota bacterium]
MITVYHLNESRSQRVLWLLEELDLPYEIVRFERDATRRAPPELAEVHPLGKAPVIRDGELLLAESGAIVEYLVERHGGGRLAPRPETDAHAAYLHWLHFAEGTAMLPLLFDLFLTIGLIPGGKEGALGDFVKQEVARQLDYVDAELGDREHLLGAFTAADVMMGFPLELADRQGHLAEHPRLRAYVERLRARSAFARAAAAA